METKATPDTGAKTTRPAKRGRAKKRREGVYSLQDIAGCARGRFGVLPEIAMAAMQWAGKQKATLAEAEKIISEFTKREVN